MVLLTNGANTKMLNKLNAAHGLALTMPDLTNARNNEFVAACVALGAHKVFIANSGAGFDESVDVSTLKNQFKTVMANFADQYPDASHKTVSGNCDSGNEACEKMPTHQAATDAMHELYDAGIIGDIRLYRVYFYYGWSPDCDPDVRMHKRVSAEDKATRVNAINEYKLVNPSIQRYGLAYRFSVAELFDKSIDSDFEYVDFIEDDC